MHGIGIENEVVLLSESGIPVQIHDSNTGQYNAKLEFTDDMFNAVVNKLNKFVFPMQIDTDNAGRPALELITLKWKNRKLHEYISDLLTTKLLLRNALNDVIIPDIFHVLNGKINDPRVSKQDRTFAKKYIGVLKKYFLDGKTRLTDWGTDVIFSKEPPLATKNSPAKFDCYYTGSYHINITLPHTRNTSDSYFQMMHVKAAMLIQWVEPLLVSLLGSPSPKAPLSYGNHTSLSIRMSNESLAMVLGRNLAQRMFSKTRYGLDEQQEEFQLTPKYFEDMYNRFQEALPLWFRMILSANSKSANVTPAHRYLSKIRKTFNGLIFIGTDFRRNSSKGEKFGFEFRLLDNFPSEHVHDVIRLLLYICDHSVENFPDDMSQLNMSKYNAFLNTSVNKYMFDAISGGWTTTVNATYYKSLQQLFDFDDGKIDKVDRIPSNVLNRISSSLYNRYEKGGPYTKHMLTPSMYTAEPIVPNVNYTMWSKYFAVRFPDIEQYLLQNGMEQLKSRFNHIVSAEAIDFDAKKLKFYYHDKRN